MFARQRASVKIKKADVAVRNLERIFDATLAVSHQKGFHAMTLRDLSRASGLSMGALYSYFSSKDELLDLIQDQGRLTVHRVLSERIETATGAQEKLAEAIRTHLFLSEIYYRWFYFSYMETKNLSKEQQAKAIESELFTEKIFIDILEQGMQEGVFSIADPRLTAAAVKALLQDWYLKRWKYTRRKITVEQYTEFVLGLIRSSIDTKGGA
ncbi:MAG TPA: TetR/AcrR family transcriptional regulator [Deltaproteobacteria bacterium]|nr:TetR/AcrR family transcriptional regulator [Deltaproteobacteria bacterium]